MIKPQAEGFDCRQEMSILSPDSRFEGRSPSSRTSQLQLLTVAEVEFSTQCLLSAFAVSALLVEFIGRS
jgi:hypothetical protein